MAAAALPEQMQALVLSAYGPPPFPLHVETRPIPRPGPGEVLVRLPASPVNPSDLMFLEGRYAFKKELPAIPGIEGSGRVVATGSGLLARRLANRRVACATMPNGGGAWAQYAVASAGQCFALPDRIDDERGAMTLVNPLAALGLIERVDALRSPAFISTAAGSALGQMLRRLARVRHVEVINVVRSADQAERLRREGVDHVLVSLDADFELQLNDLSARLEARVALDAIGGTMTARLLSALPRHGRVILYGALAIEASVLNPADVIFGDKVMEGFYVPNWLAKKSLPQIILLQRRVIKLLGNDLSTAIRARARLDEAAQAIADYANSMTGGKLLILPNVAPAQDTRRRPGE